MLQPLPRHAPARTAADALRASTDRSTSALIWMCYLGLISAVFGMIGV